MLNKILQRVGWFGLLFAIGFLVCVTLNGAQSKHLQFDTSLTEWKAQLEADEWQAIMNAGLAQCSLSSTTRIPLEVRVGARDAIEYNGSLNCPDESVIAGKDLFLLRMQSPQPNIQPRGEIRTRSEKTVWTITGSDSGNWQGTLRVDLLAGDLPISIVAAPIDIKFVRFLGMSQTGVIILTVFLFVIPMACLMIAEWRKKSPEPAGSSPK